MSRLCKIVQLQKRVEIYGKLAIVWAGSKAPPDDFIKFKLSKLIKWLKKSGFKKEASEISGII